MGFSQAGVRSPDELVTEAFLLRPLRAADVDLDYEAVMENPAMLRLSGGGVWPADDFTRQANLADLLVHEREHEDGVAYTYTVLSADQSQCLGCVYVNQLAKTQRLTTVTGETPEAIDERQAIVRYWVRQSRVSGDLDWRLVTTLIDWFGQAWRLGDVYFRAHALDQRQQHLMEQAGLPWAYTFEVPGRQGPFLAFGPIGLV